MKIGVLALQGAFREHLSTLAAIDGAPDNGLAEVLLILVALV